MMAQDLETLITMHTYRRPMGSDSEAEFRRRFILPLGAVSDKFGNLMLTVGEEKPTILWSAHTDSVHQDGGTQKIHLDGNFIRLHQTSKSSCLGADDAAGCWILMQMIEAKVPGLYIFHYGEERGGVGSRAIADKTPEVLDGIQAAIAFDRRGTNSVITHQGSRTCSDAFGRSMMAQLKDYRLDEGGTFTDTKVYRELVPECTNLSVGYYSEHSPSERLDVDHLVRLRDQMIRIDPTRFVIERDPKADRRMPAQTSLGFPAYSSFAALASNLRRREPEDLAELLERFPHSAAKVLEAAGVDFHEFRELVMETSRERQVELDHQGSRGRRRGDRSAA